MIFKIVFGKQIHLLNSIDSFNALIQGVKTSFKKLPTSFSVSYVDAEGDHISISNQQDFTICQTSLKADKPVRVVIQEVQEEKIVTEIPISEKTGYVEIIEEPQQSIINKEVTPVIVKQQSQVSIISQQQVEAMVQSEVQKLIPNLTESILKNVSNASQPKPSKQSSSKESKIPSETVVHEHVTCDGCKAYPITGFRYKCIICHNFDFCEKCQGEGKHPHAFIKIRHPSQVPSVLIATQEDICPGLDINGQKFDAQKLKNISPLISLANTFIPGLNMTQEKVKNIIHNFHGRMKNSSCSQRMQNFMGGLFEGLKKKQEEVQKKQKPAEEKCEQKAGQKSEVPKQECGRNKLKDRENAEYLKQLFQDDMITMLNFVESNPTLDKYELAEKLINQRTFNDN